MGQASFRSFAYLIIGIYLGLHLPLPHLPNLKTQTFLLQETTVEGYRNHTHLGDSTVAEFMAEKVKVFCGILVGKDNQKTIGRAVKETWARKCNGRQFFSTADDDLLPATKISEGPYNFSLVEWEMTSSALKSIYDNEIDNYDWFLIAKENCYVIFENMRKLLISMDTKDPLALGAFTKKSKNQTKYALDLGSSVVLSKSALKNLVEIGLNSKGGCAPSNDKSANYAFQTCLFYSGVNLKNGRDSEDKFRFAATNPLYYFEDNISETAASFHAYGRRGHRTLEYLIYHIFPYGAEGIKRN